MNLGLDSAAPSHPPQNAILLRKRVTSSIIVRSRIFTRFARPFNPQPSSPFAQFSLTKLLPRPRLFPAYHPLSFLPFDTLSIPLSFSLFLAPSLTLPLFFSFPLLPTLVYSLLALPRYRIDRRRRWPPLEGASNLHRELKLKQSWIQGVRPRHPILLSIVSNVPLGPSLVISLCLRLPCPTLLDPLSRFLSA